MGKKILSKSAIPKQMKKQEIKKTIVPSQKYQVKKSPKKILSEKKHSKVTQKKKPKNANNNVSSKVSQKQTNKVQPSKKKQTKKSLKKVKQSKQVQQSFGSKKMNIKKKKQQKKQRLQIPESYKNFEQKQQNYKIQIQKQHQASFAIYRKQVPQRWRESIIRYHEAKMSLNERQNNISNLHSSSSYDPSYNVKTNTFNDTKNGTPNQKKPKEQYKEGIRKSFRLNKSKTPFNNQSQQIRFPQVIEISSSHNSGRSQNNFVSFDFQQNNYQDSSKLQRSYKRSDQQDSISVNNVNITPQKYQIQKENDSSVSNYLRGQSSKSESKVSYQYEIMSLSSSKQNSKNIQIHSHQGKGKDYQKISQKSQISHVDNKSQSSQNSSHSISPQYVVERIVSSKIKGGKTLYEIKWVGYPDEQNTLQPIKNLKNIMEMVVDFQKRQKQTFKQTFKQNQKILAAKNRQLASKNKQLAYKTKKIDEMKKKIEELTRRVKDFQKQKKVLTKVEQSIRLKNQGNIKQQINEDQNKLKKQFNGAQGNFKIKLFQEDSEKDKTSNSTQITTNEIKNSSPINPSIHSSKQMQKEISLLKENCQKVIALQIPQKIEQKIKQEFLNDNLTRKKLVEQNIEEQLMINEEKNEMILPLSNENMIRIDDFDQGDIHPDLQMVEYSFPFFNIENQDKNYKNQKYLLTDQNVIQQNNLQNHALMEEYDCLKYFSTDQ